MIGDAAKNQTARFRGSFHSLLEYGVFVPSPHRGSSPVPTGLSRSFQSLSRTVPNPHNDSSAGRILLESPMCRLSPCGPRGTATQSFVPDFTPEAPGGDGQSEDFPCRTKKTREDARQNFGGRSAKIEERSTRIMSTVTTCTIGDFGGESIIGEVGNFGGVSIICLRDTFYTLEARGSEEPPWGRRVCANLIFW